MGLLKIPAKPSMKFCVKAEGWKNAKYVHTMWFFSGWSGEVGAYLPNFTSL